MSFRQEQNDLLKLAIPLPFFAVNFPSFPFSFGQIHSFSCTLSSSFNLHMAGPSWYKVLGGRKEKCPKLALP